MRKRKLSLEKEVLTTSGVLPLTVDGGTGGFCVITRKIAREVSFQICDEIGDCLGSGSCPPQTQTCDCPPQTDACSVACQTDTPGGPYC